MHKLPMTAKQAKQLVESGHMTPETHADALRMGAFMPDEVQHFDEGGTVQPTASLDPKDFESPEQYASALTALNPGMSTGDALAQNAIDTKKAQDADTLLPGENFADQRERLQAAQAQNPISNGVQVASNDPAADRQIASTLVNPAQGQPQAQPTEAGHMPQSALVAPQSQAPDDRQIQQGSDIGQITKGMAQERQGISQEFKAGQKQADEAAGFIHQARVHQEVAEAQRQKMEEQRQVEATAQYQKVQNAADQAAQASKINPNQFWESRSTPQKIMAAIGIALGGIGGGLSGHGGNAAMDVINKAIDRDIDAQKFNANQKQNAFQNQMGVYNVMRSKFGDERTAEAATRLAYMQNVEMQLKETAAKYQSPEMQAKFNMMMGKVQQQQGALMQQIHASAYQMAAMRQLTGGGAGSAAALAALPKDVQERVVPLNGGTSHGIAYSAEGAKSVREVSSAADNINQIIREMRELKEQGGKRLLPYGTLASKSQGLQSRLIPAINELAGLKRLSEEDIKNITKQIPDAGSWMSDKTDAMLSGLEQSVHDRTESYYRNNLMGYRPNHFKATR
jgi:hypothetical protein